MARLAAVLGAVLLVVVLAAVAGSGMVDRAIVYPFNPTRTDPPAGLTEVEIPTGDGETLVAWIAPPAPGKPTVLYFHGNAGNLAVRASRFTALTARGHGLVAAGYRGSSGSSGTPSEAALIADAETLAEALPGLTGPGPMVYYGESLGAAVAIALAESRPPAALVLEAPFSSIADMAAVLYGTALAAHLSPSTWPSRARIARVSAPLLVLHGEHDTLVPPSQGRAVFDAAASPDKTFELVAGAGHLDVWQPAAQRTLFAFLDRF